MLKKYILKILREELRRREHIKSIAHYNLKVVEKALENLDSSNPDISLIQSLLNSKKYWEDKMEKIDE